MKISTPCLVAAAMVMLPAAQSSAQVLVEDNFDSYTAGDQITLTNSLWNPKWDGNDISQQNLLVADDGYAVIDMSVAARQYEIPNQTGFTVNAGDTVTVSSDMRYSHLAGQAANGNGVNALNSTFVALHLTDQPEWWNGAKKALDVVNRGPAVGNRLPFDPWVENWMPHSNLGVDPAVGGISDWINVAWELTVNSAGNIEGVGIFSGASLAEPLMTSPVDLGIAGGTTVYAGLSTSWNNAGIDPATGFAYKVSEVTQIDAIHVDNFLVTLGGDTGGLAADFNEDGIVDLLDLDVLGSNWQSTGATKATGDANGDGTVDLLDLDVLGGQWQQSSSFAEALAASGIAVPEPGSLVLLGLGSLMVARRRR